MVSRAFVVALLGAVLATSVVVPLVWMQPPAGATTIVFFDGVCNMCNAWVNFLLDVDRDGRVRFAAIQENRALLDTLGAPSDLSTMVVAQGAQLYTHAEGALRTLAVLPFPLFPLATLALVTPSSLQDTVYAFVAANRYRVFGATDTCRQPDERHRSRFLQTDAHAAERDNDNDVRTLLSGDGARSLRTPQPLRTFKVEV